MKDCYWRKSREKENISFAVFGISWVRPCFYLGLDFLFVKVRSNKTEAPKPEFPESRIRNSHCCGNLLDFFPLFVKYHYWWVEKSAGEWSYCYLPKHLAFRSVIAEDRTNLYSINPLSWKNIFLATAYDEGIWFSNCSWTRGKSHILSWLWSYKPKEEILKFFDGESYIKATGNTWLKTIFPKSLQWMQIYFQ